MQFTGERVFEDSTPNRIWLDHIARYKFAGKYVKGKDVLDIACGTGYGSKFLKDAGAAKVIGVDISIDAIDFAIAKYKMSGLEFKFGNMLNINFPESYFDVIVSFETIEHIKNPERAIAELHRVLKPKGILIVSTPNRKLTSPGKSFNDAPNNPFHVKEYYTKEFISILSGHFKILEVYGQRGINKLFLLPILERILRKLLPVLYNPERGEPELEQSSSRKEYRYITVICRKINGKKI